MTRADLEAMNAVAMAFESLGIRYVIGGSVASSFHGTPRSTADVDVLAELREEHVARLVELLEATCYVDAESARVAARRRTSFNVIHFDTSYKVDVFVADAGRTAEIERGQVAHVFGAGVRPFPVATAEDTVVAKLRWYRQGGEVSQQQWTDLVGVLRLSAKTIDAARLRARAEEERVADLLSRAQLEAKSGI